MKESKTCYIAKADDLFESVHLELFSILFFVIYQYIYLRLTVSIILQFFFLQLKYDLIKVFKQKMITCTSKSTNGEMKLTNGLILYSVCY